MDAAHDLEALAKRVEAAAGPDRELDAAVAVALGWVRIHNPTSAGGLVNRWYQPDGSMTGHEGCPLYTASLDAAMTLVPEGCQWLRKCPRTMTVYVPPIGDKEWSQHIDAHGETPALALAAASLRALSQGVNDD